MAQRKYGTFVYKEGKNPKNNWKKQLTKRSFLASVRKFTWTFSIVEVMYQISKKAKFPKKIHIGL